MMALVCLSAAELLVEGVVSSTRFPLTDVLARQKQNRESATA